MIKRKEKKTSLLQRKCYKVQNRNSTGIREYARQLRWNGDKRENFSGRNMKASTVPPLTTGTRAAKPL